MGNQYENLRERILNQLSLQEEQKVDSAEPTVLVPEDVVTVGQIAEVVPKDKVVEVIQKAKFAIIENVEELVEVGRVPIKLHFATTSEWVRGEGNRIDKFWFYNVPPHGFTLGKNGCTGQGDAYEMTIDYFDGDGVPLGGGSLYQVGILEAREMDQRIDEARTLYGY